MNATKESGAQALNEQQDFYSSLSKNPQEALIPVFTSEITNDLMVDARELHNRLKIQTPFHKWIQRRIEEYDFQEGLDYWSNLSVRSDGKAGRKRIQYQLTSIMAQELCVLDNSAFGKAIRLFLLKLLNESHDKTGVFKDIPYLTINGRKLYCYRSLQRLLGFSTKSSISNIRRKYADQLHIHFRTAYVTEEYALLMVARSEARKVAEKTLSASPIVLSNQLNLFLK